MEMADGASSVTTMPGTQRVSTSMATARQGRPMGCLSRSSTMFRSIKGRQAALLPGQESLL